MRKQLIDLLQMPQKTIFNRKIPKKQFYEQGQITTDEKKLLTTEIDSIYLLSICKQDNLHIPKFVHEDRRYEEIYWLFISFRSIQRLDRMIKMFHKTMPNPLVILVTGEDENICISTAHKRLNANDQTKAVVEDVQTSPWLSFTSTNRGIQRFLERLRFNNLSYRDFFAFYDSVNAAVRMSVLIEKTGNYPLLNRSSDELLPLMDAFETAEQNVAQLQQQQKEQLDFGEKMEIHMKMVKQEENKKQLLEQIQELC